METTAVKRVFGEHAKDVQLSSIKSMIGHSIGASGAIEAAALAMSLHTQVYPPTINLTNPDPQCDLDYIPEHGPRRPREVRALHELRLRRPERRAGHGRRLSRRAPQPISFPPCQSLRSD